MFCDLFEYVGSKCNTDVNEKTGPARSRDFCSLVMIFAAQCLFMIIKSEYEYHHSYNAGTSDAPRRTSRPSLNPKF